MKKKIFICFIFSSILLAIHLNAEEKFLSLKKNKVNVRYGPSFDFEIKYIYKKINPVCSFSFSTHHFKQY